MIGKWVLLDAELAFASLDRDAFKSWLRKSTGWFNTPIENAVRVNGALFCPECTTHEQRDNDPATHFAHGDCKNEIGEVKRDPVDFRFRFFTTTQCACKGPAHGGREGWF